jgi:two-component system, NarL family, sensor histidine kinase UhpB
VPLAVTDERRRLGHGGDRVRGVRHLRDKSPLNDSIRAREGPRFCWSVTDSLERAVPLPSIPSSAEPTDHTPVGLETASASRPFRPSRLRGTSLLWWVLLPNVGVLVGAFVLLAVTPITISAPIEADQLALLFVGLAVLVAANVVLLRRVLAPLFALAETMSSVDPDRPGRRLVGVNPRSAEGRALAEAFNSMLDRLELARREAARTALAAQEAERVRVARELHDEIGQTLTAVMLQAERAADEDPAQAAAALGRVAEAVHASLDELRRIARELRPEALDDLGLVNALIALCSRIDAQGGPHVRRDLDSGLPPMSRETELVIYRVAQESLTNALRHSGAATATVSLKRDAGTVTLTVTDDGKGIPEQLPAATAGIAGMRERALLVGARLSIGSRQEEGTEIRLTVPVEESS